ncbi:MAG: gamma-glutamyltransferase [Bryobacterales bacterium]|nr:gamma-glutamyltransferase [Bryobacterales bacterium]
MIAAGTDHGTEAGIRLYHLGGNAVDAGVAATFVGAIAEYSNYGFGGEAPILVRTKDGKVFSIAGVGTMPKAATAELFRTRRMQRGEFFGGEMEPNGLKGIIPVAGLMPALVPSMVDASLVALKAFGTRPLSEVMQPAIELADGMPLDEMRAGAIVRCTRFFELWPTSKRVFLANGRYQMPGEIFRQPDLARTMRSMVAAEQKALKAGKNRAAAIDAVRDFFYRGEIARKIDQFMKDNNGLLRYEDMAAFKLQPEPAVSTAYRGYEIHKAGYYTQGPALIEALNILEGIDLQSLRHNSADYLHQTVEALKLAYADRDTYYGDPKFVKMPAELLTKQYAAERRALIGARASQDFRPGKVGTERRLHPSQAEMVMHKIDDMLMARDTTCIDAMDKEGVSFSVTPSGAWLPSVIAGDTGIPLTQRAQSFLLVEGHPNELAGGKRPRVTLSPTLVTKDGKPYMALSTPGGDNQDQALLQLILNVVEFGMDAEEAVESARFQTRHLVASFDNHAMNPGDLLLDDRISKATIENLANRGHKVSTRSRWASGSAPVLVRILPNGVLEGGADPYGYRTAAAW